MKNYLKSNLKVAYLGLDGSFTFLACQKYFKHKIKKIATATIAEVVSSVETQKTDFGLIPLENSQTGSIFESYDALINQSVTIVGEIFFQINHYLIGLKKVAISLIRRCYSHPQVFMQCSNFFKKYHFIEPEFKKDTASAAKYLIERNKSNETVIASSEIAKTYHLKILKENIQDHKINLTRFVVIAKNKNQEGNKISLAFFVSHVPGSLFRALKPFADRGLNLTKIESRPIPNKPWEYVFLLDFEIGQKRALVDDSISELRQETNRLKILGRFNKGKNYEA